MTVGPIAVGGSMCGVTNTRVPSECVEEAEGEGAKLGDESPSNMQRTMVSILSVICSSPLSSLGRRIDGLPTTTSQLLL